MASVSETRPEFRELARKTSRFDRVTSLMLALVILSGSLVTWLSAVWITNRVWKVKSTAVSVELIEIASDDEEGMAGDDPELGEGKIIEASDLPAREENLLFDQTAAPDAMSMVLEAIAEREADFAAPSRQEGEKAAGRAGAPGGTGREGTGAGSSAIPRSQRWSIVYPKSQSLKAYARQLDFFGIELGIVQPGGQLTYASNLSRGKPVVKRGGADEERLYFIWQDAARREADRELLKRAGLPAEGAVIAQFFPARLEEKLAELERSHANRRPEEIRLTQFGVRRAQGGHEFHVAQQNYHTEQE